MNLGQLFSLEHWGHRLAGLLGERTDYGTTRQSPTIAAAQQYLQSYPLSSLLPYRSYDTKSGLFYNDNSTGFMIETYPMVGCTEEMQRELSGLFQNTLPEGASLQFLLYADPRIDDLLADWQQPRLDQGGLYADIAQRRRHYLAGLVSQPDCEVIPRNLRCVISYSESGWQDGPVEQARLSQIRDQVLAALKTLGVPVKAANADDLLQLVDGLINFKLDASPSALKWRQLDSLAEQIPHYDSGLQVSPEHLMVNERNAAIKTYSLAATPEYWSLYAMGELIGDSLRDILRVGVPFMLHYGLVICDQHKVQSRLQRPQDWVERQAHSKIGRNIPMLKAQARELDFTRQQLAKGERYVHSSFNAVLLCPPQHLTAQEQILKSLFRSKRWELRADRYIQLQQLLSVLPMTWGEGLPAELGFHRRLKTTLSSEAANMLPIQGEWKGNSRTGIPLIGRRGQLFCWDPFASDAGNYNVSVVGRSGSGKSVFMQELVMNGLGTGGQVFIIDVGRSFEKLVKLLGGTYLEFKPETNICLNPFSIIPVGDAQETADALAMLQTVVSLMAAPKDGTNDLEDAYIERAIKAAWQARGQTATISDVAVALQDMAEPLALTLSAKLFAYTAAGSYGRYFNGAANIDLSAPMVVVELEELKGRPDLQAVVLQLIILQITNRLYLGDRKRRTYLILDEAWDLLRARQAGEFIETAARRFRKYRGSLVVGTQSVHDFYVSPGAQAAFDNSDWLCLLSQKPESIEQLKKMQRLSVDGHLEEALLSLKTKAGDYAEVLIKGAHGYAIGRLKLDAFSGLLYSTKAEEFAAVQDLVQQGYSLADAIDQLIGRRGQV